MAGILYSICWQPENIIHLMVNNSNEKVEESLLMFHIATWVILLNRHEEMNLVALVPLIQYHREEKLLKEQ